MNRTGRSRNSAGFSPGVTLDASFQAVRRFGHVVSCLGWGTHALGPLSFRAATYSGVFTLLPLLTGARWAEGRYERFAAFTRELVDGSPWRLTSPGAISPFPAGDVYCGDGDLSVLLRMIGNPNRSRLSRPRVASLRPLLGRTPRPFCKAPSFWPRPRGRQGRRRQCRSPAPLYRASASTRNAQRKEITMSTNETYLAVFLGSKTSPRMAAWNALPEEERRAKMQEGIAAWKAWVDKHQSAIVGMGGPLGKTKRVTGQGIEDVSNQLSGYTIVRAASHEAATKLFEKHPHFTNFPGECIEIMPVLPIPGA
jgi:hypothetical protein